MAIISSDKLRDFFRWVRSKEFLAFLFSLLVAGSFWAVLAIKDVVEYEIAFPVTITNQPSNVVINHDGNDTLRATIRDNGYNILGYLYHKSSIEVSFTKGDDGKISISTADLLKKVKGKLEKSAEVVAVKPDRLDIYYSYGDFAYKPVAINGSITAADKYFLVKREVVPESVKVKAMPSRLEKIDSVRTMYLSIRDVTEKESKTVALQRISGVTMEPSEVTVEVIADILSEMSREVDIQTINVPEGKLIRTIPGRLHVNFVAPAQSDKLISSDDFTVVVDYNEVHGDANQQTLPLHLMRKPRSASKVTLELKEVDFKIEQQ